MLYYLNFFIRHANIDIMKCVKKILRFFKISEKQNKKNQKKKKRQSQNIDLRGSPLSATSIELRRNFTIF